MSGTSRSDTIGVEFLSRTKRGLAKHAPARKGHKGSEERYTKMTGIHDDGSEQES